MLEKTSVKFMEEILMTKTSVSRFIGAIALALVLLVGFTTTRAFAAEPDNIFGMVQPRSGVETLPLNTWYTISSHFSIDGHNYTPVKTVEGRYLKLNINTCLSLDEDKGNGPVRVTIKIRDYNSRNFISGAVSTFTMERGVLMTGQPVFDLGYSGRKIQIYTEITSLNSSDPATRVIDFYDYRSYSYN